MTNLLVESAFDRFPLLSKESLETPLRFEYRRDGAWWGVLHCHQELRSRLVKGHHLMGQIRDPGEFLKIVVPPRDGDPVEDVVLQPVGFGRPWRILTQQRLVVRFPIARV